MPNKNNENACDTIEDAIRTVLSGKALINAVDFISFLQANDMPPIRAADNVWNANYKESGVCVIYVDGGEQMPGPWTIWSDGECDYSDESADFPMDEPAKEIVWANINPCASCGGNCSPGTHKTILGKNFNNLCGSSLAFTNPNAQTLECVKTLMQIRKSAIHSMGESS